MIFDSLQETSVVLITVGKNPKQNARQELSGCDRNSKEANEMSSHDDSQLQRLAEACSKSMYNPGPSFLGSLEKELRIVFCSKASYAQFKHEMDVLLARFVNAEISGEQFRDEYSVLAETIESAALSPKERSQMDLEIVHLLDAFHLLSRKQCTVSVADSPLDEKVELLVHRFPR